MQNPYIRNKFYLYGSKVILLFAFIVAMQGIGHAQHYTYAKRNNPNYDLRKLSYGFLIGIHTTAYQIKYSKSFATVTTPPNDSLYAIEPQWSPGFSLGFIVNYRIADFFDLRTTPNFAFYEHRLKYRFINSTQDQLIETVMVEVPLLLKYKSERRGNVRMYMIGGAKVGIEASGKKHVENSAKGFDVKGTNTSLEMGFGFDLYYPLFKFSPEIRFSKGIANMLDKSKYNLYSDPLQRVNTNTITLYLLFQ
jgi:hypothetical protein